MQSPQVATGSGAPFSKSITVGPSADVLCGTSPATPVAGPPRQYAEPADHQRVGHVRADRPVSGAGGREGAFDALVAQTVDGIRAHEPAHRCTRYAVDSDPGARFPRNQRAGRRPRAAGGVSPRTEVAECDANPGTGGDSVTGRRMNRRSVIAATQPSQQEQARGVERAHRYHLPRVWASAGLDIRTVAPRMAAAAGHPRITRGP